jgi:hypothetical protein
MGSTLPGRQPVTPEQERAAQEWAARHGYAMGRDGWVFQHGRALCHGWPAFYRLFRRSIEAAADDPPVSPFRR